MRASGKFLGYTSRSYAGLMTVLSFMVGLMGFAPLANAQNVKPNLVVSTSTVLGSFTSAGTLAGANAAGNTFAVNTNGDVIVGTTYGNQIDLFSQSKGTVTVLGTYGNVSAVAVDAANNLYIGDLYTVGILKLPYVAGAYATFTAPSSTYTPPACTGTDTVECQVSGLTTAGDGYYFGTTSITFDGSGNLFFATDGSGATNPYSILECTVACQNTGTPGATLLYTEPTSTSVSTTGQLTIGGLAVGPLGNVFFTDSAINTTSGANSPSFSSNLKELKVTGGVYATTPTTIYNYTVPSASVAASDDQIDGVVTDANNVYMVSQYDGVYGFPNNAGVVNPANIFAVTTQGAKSMAYDGKGNFYLDYYKTSGDVMGKISMTTLAAGTGTVGTAVTIPATVLDNTGTCTTITGVTFKSSIPDYTAATSGACASTNFGGYATFPTTISFNATANGTRTATLTATDNLAMAGTVSITGTGTGGATVTVATPTFSPAGGTYTATQTVAISDATASSTIYYTTNGTTPTTSSTVYTAPITVSATETIMALATATGDTNSAIGSATYTINQPTAATPTFTPAAGTYTSAQNVTIADTTAGATIYYTTNGTAPTTGSTVYTGPVSVGTSETLMAIATATGYGQSTAGSAAYVINLPAAATPTFSPAGGTYTATQSVTIADATTGATIYYTTNGTTPTTSSTVYSGAISVTASETINAIATATNYSTSATGSAAYMINLPAAATPTFSPAGGTYGSTQTVTLADTTAGAKIYYTLDGSTPTTSSTLYTAPISVATSETINALATATNFTNSAVASATYTLAVATPSYSPAGGTYTSVQSVTIADTTTGAAIYYTTNGTTPTSASTLYTGPISVGTTETIMSIAVLNGYTSSTVASAAYTINLPAAATPTFSPAGGTYTAAQTVTIADTTAGAKIYYTLDGSTPTTSSTLYTASISVTASETINAIATATGASTSAVGSAAYVINIPVAAAPTFSPAAGTYTSAQAVTLSSTTMGAAIYYTTNGSVPTINSTLYTAPIVVGTSETIMAIATATGSTSSAVSSAAYVINLPVTASAATPTFSVAGGTYAAKQTVTIADATPGATIYYTTNGSTPTTSSTVYTAAITVASSETLSAIAVAPGFNNSAVATAVYTISTTSPSFSIAVNPAALTVTDGSSGTVAVSITPNSGYSSAVTLSCSGLPTTATCSFAPATVTPTNGAAATSTLTIATQARTSSVQTLPGFGSGSVISGATFAGMLCLLGFKKRRRLQALLLVLVGVVGLGLMTGCGSSSSISHNPVSTVVTVTATDGTLTTSGAFTLTIN